MMLSMDSPDSKVAPFGVVNLVIGRPWVGSAGGGDGVRRLP